MRSHKFPKDLYSETFPKREKEIELSFHATYVRTIGSFNFGHYLREAHT